jgi:hypothetical protein
MTRTVAFLFLDECAYQALDLAALTGVLVPLKHYGDVRDEMCRLVRDIQPTKPNTIPQPIELHGRNLLSDLQSQDPDALDRARLRVLQTVVGLVNDYRLDIFRVTYLNRKEVARSLRHDPALYGVTFLGIQASLQRLMEHTLVIPVMDGIPGWRPTARRPPRIDPTLIRAFAHNVRYLHHLRQYEAVASSISLANAHNLGEPLFADSAHSVLLQLVDLVSHLLLQLDREELEPNREASPYRIEVLRQAKALDRKLLHCWRGNLRCDLR